MHFKEWLVLEQSHNKLVVFDFDGTIALVPEKPKTLTPDQYRGWNGSDWWGSQASLSTPEEGGFWSGLINQKVVSAFKDATNDPNSHVIVLTGRRGVSAPHVRKILNGLGLQGKRMISPQNKNFEDNDEKDYNHEQYFTGDWARDSNYPQQWSKKKKRNVPASDTLSHKRFVIEKLIKEKGIDIVEIWDDRKDHIENFKTILQEYLDNNILKSVIIHIVYPMNHPNVNFSLDNSHPNTTTTVQHFVMKPKEIK